MLELKNIKKEFKTKKETITPLKDINIILPNHGLVFILGPSGCGKSTLLNLIGGLDTPTSGSLTFNNLKLNDLSNEELDSYRLNKVGFIFQDFNLLDNLNVYDNIKFSLDIKGIKDNELINNTLNSLEISHLKTRKIKELSGGEKARVGIARCLVKNPSLILADEPTGNLDEENRNNVFNILKKISQEKLVVVVSHDLEAAQSYADKILYLENGYIKAIEDKTILPTFLEEITLKKSTGQSNFKLKYSLSLLKRNPLRYLIIILILSITFSFLILDISIQNININKSHAEALKLNHDYNYEIIKGDVTSSNLMIYNESELKEVTNYLEQNNIKYRLDNHVITNDTNIMLMFANILDTPAPIYNYFYPGVMSNDNTFYEVPENYFDDYNFIGSFPTGPNEIVISNYFAKFIRHYGVYDTFGNIYKPTTNEEIVKDKVKIDFNGNYLIVTGIYDIPNAPISDFEKITYYTKEIRPNSFKAFFSNEELFNIVRYNMFDFYVNENFFEISSFLPNYRLDKEIYPEYITHNNENIVLGYKNMAYLPEKGNYTLNDNEIIINRNILNIITDNDYQNKLAQETNLNEEEFLKLYLEEHNILNTTIELCIKNAENKELNYYNLTIKGVTLNEEYNSPYYISHNILDKYILPNKVMNRIDITDKNLSKIELVLNKFPLEDNHFISLTDFSTDFIENVDIINNALNLGKTLIIPLIIINVLLFTLFITWIIKFLKKNFGIMRALGVSKKDIFVIMLNLDFILLIIAFLISLILPELSFKYLNSYISSKLYFKVNFLYWHFKYYYYLLLTLVLCLIISTIIPLQKLNKLNPINIIRKIGG